MQIRGLADARLRVALIRGLAVALLLAVVGYDVSQFAAPISSGVPAAVGLTLGLVLAGCMPLVFSLAGRLADAHDDTQRMRSDLVAAEEIAASALRQVERAATVAAPTSLQALGSGLLRVRHELGIHQRRLTAAAASGSLWSYAEQLPSDEQWLQIRTVVSAGSLADAGLYSVLADAYAEAGRVARGNALRLLAGLPSTVTPADRLPDAVLAVDLACAYLDELLGLVADTVAVSPPLTSPAPGFGRDVALVDVGDEHDRPVVA